MYIESTIQAVGYDAATGTLLLLDQTRIPAEERTLRLEDVDAICEAIYMLRVRGAPAIGVAAAYGICAVARHSEAHSVEDLRADVESKAAQIEATRPTAINLRAAVQRLRPLWQRGVTGREQLLQALEAEARALDRYEIEASQAMGQHAFEIFGDGDGVITHCNTGALAAPGIGTALGTVLWALRHGKRLRVFADETRPLLQGGRLTTWECLKNDIPCTLITDNMAAVVLRDRKVQLAIVGSDRIAANGDAANKIGTYGLAVLCKHHGVPFYIAAPMTTVDFECPTGAEIPIEQRRPEEVRGAFGTTWAPEAVDVFNPAFDVTPGELIAGIVTDRGLARPPYTASLAAMRSDG
ncbi:MAG: S-methyl-5-thioribose-1-phosphate isomerase [Pseudomonadota bacterium]